MSERRDDEDRRAPLNTGPGRLISAVYAMLALAAVGRSAVQLLGSFSTAPLAYILSGIAAVLYVVATVAMVRGDRAWRVAVLAVSIELVGVLTVGALSLLRPDLFPDRTVWSHFGQGYAFIPLVLPFVGLWWLFRGSGRPAQRVAQPPVATGDGDQRSG